MRKSRERLVIFTLVLLTAGLFLLSLTVGSYPLRFTKVVESLQTYFTTENEMPMAGRVFWGLRLPRVLTGLLAGMTLGLCGGIYQLLFQSPLASPDLTGVASGASFGAAFALLVGAETIGRNAENAEKYDDFPWFEDILNAISSFCRTSPGRMTAAFLGGMLSLLLVFLLLRGAGSQGKMMQSCVLAGIVISAASDCGLMILKILADPEQQLAAIDFWTMGSLASVSHKQTIPLAMVNLPILLLILLCHRPVSMLALGDDTAAAMGVNASYWRKILLLLATLAVSSVTAVTGVIGFVGLIAPHVTRLLVKRVGGVWLAGSMLTGGILLLLADMGARSLGNGAELPVSIFTVAAGVPVLVVLFCQSGRRRM